MRLGVLVAALQLGWTDAYAGPLERAQALVDEGDLDRAEQIATRYLEQHPEGTDANDMLVVLEFIDYERAAQINNVSAWRAFRAKWPHGGHISKAYAREAACACSSDLATADLRQLRRLRNDYPNTSCADQARNREYGIAFDLAAAEGTSAAWHQLLIEYRDHPRKADAFQREEESAFVEATAKGTSAALLQLLINYPTHPKKAEVIAREDDLAYSEAVGTLDDLREFLILHPESRHEKEVLNRLLADTVVLKLLGCTDESPPMCSSMKQGDSISATWQPIPGHALQARLVGWRTDGSTIPLRDVFADLVTPDRRQEGYLIAAELDGETSASGWTLRLRRPLRRSAAIDGFAVVVEAPGLTSVTLPFRILDVWSPPPVGAIWYHVADRSTQKPVCMIRANGMSARVDCEQFMDPLEALASRSGWFKWQWARAGDIAFVALRERQGELKIATVSVDGGPPNVILDCVALGLGDKLSFLSDMAEEVAGAKQARVVLVQAEGRLGVLDDEGTLRFWASGHKPFTAFDKAILSPDGGKIFVVWGGNGHGQSGTNVEVLDATTFEVLRHESLPNEFEHATAWFQPSWQELSPGPMFPMCYEGPGCYQNFQFILDSGYFRRVSEEEYSAYQAGRDSPSSNALDGRTLNVSKVKGLSEVSVYDPRSRTSVQISNARLVGPDTSCTEDYGCSQMDDIRARWLPGDAWVGVIFYRSAGPEGDAGGPMFVVRPDGSQHVWLSKDEGDFPAYLFTNWSADGRSLLTPDGRVLLPDGKLLAGPKGAEDAHWYEPTLDAWLR